MKVLNLTNFQKEAERALQQAREKAEEIIESARKEAEAIKENALNEAQQKIKEEVETKLKEKEAVIRKELTQKLNEENSRTLTVFTSEFRGEMKNLFDELNSKIVSLAIMIARKIIMKEVQTSPEIITNILSDAMNFIVSSRKYRIVTGPASLEKVNSFVESLRSDHMFRNSSFEVSIDDSMAPGSCRIETPEVVVDATIEEQLKKLEGYLK